MLSLQHIASRLSTKEVSIIGSILRNIAGPSKNVIVEFSSPNIAKPFHVGHLRSTIIGNFLSNVFVAAGNSVTRINYLGDWGTQFGLLSLAFEKFGNADELKSKGLHHLFDLYVKANQLNKSDSEFAAEALQRFASLECADSTSVALWKMMRSVSLTEFEKSYKRLDICFDKIDGESMYAESGKKLVDQWKSMGLIQFGDQEALGIRLSADHFLLLLKSDGSSLYLTRDLAAVLDRSDKLKFDEMYYVVDERQSAYFKSLKVALHHLNYSSLSERIHHVPFGTIKGMSTREGNVVFLDDLMEEGKRIAADLIRTCPTRKISEDDIEPTAENFMRTGLIVDDLRYSRSKTLTFDWKNRLRIEGISGIYLQRCHAKLCNLDDNCVHKPKRVGDNQGSSDFYVDYTLLKEPQALDLMKHLSTESLHCVLSKCYQEKESHYWLDYLYELCRLVGPAYNTLYINGEEDSRLALTRLLLFNCARRILKEGLELIGAVPLLKW